MRLASCASLTIALGFALLSCVTQYVPPSSKEPHAIVKFRRRYEQHPGTALTEVLLIDGQRAFRKTDRPAHATVPRTDAVLVHPATAPVEMSATFSHQQTVFVQESYPCGAATAPRSCYRTTQRQQTMVDGSCKKELTVPMEAGQNYLFELDYQDRRNRHARCWRQRPAGEGKFENSPCPVVAPRP